ncbi:MAG: prepilin peptidase [Planctomycetota bacterium]|nr:MAG: prepilin peptidase [Planctomycetota bacterium]
MLTFSVLLVLLAVATYTDVRGQHIYNWTTYPGMALGLLLNGLGTLALKLQLVDESLLRELGWIGLGAGLSGWLICGLIMVVCFVFFPIGGGDVKLIAMIGAFMGPERGIEAMLWAFVLGACLALIVLVWRVGAWRLVRQVVRHVFWSLRLGRFDRLTDEERAMLQPPLFLAPTALAGVVIVHWRLDAWLIG